MIKVYSTPKEAEQVLSEMIRRIRSVVGEFQPFAGAISLSVAYGELNDPETLKVANVQEFLSDRFDMPIDKDALAKIIQAINDKEST